jgi:hypothetical protein
MFYERSSGEPHPGKGAGEKINVGDVKDYVELSTKPSTTGGENSTIRGKIAVQHKRKTYASVTHYYNGSKFKHGFPDFFDKFNMESKSEISTDVNMAKIAGSMDGNCVKKSKHARPKNITIDPEFYPEKVWEEALRAKFTQHIDLSAILKDQNRKTG